MEKEEKVNIEKLMCDVIIDKPITFTLGKKYFHIFLPSLGITLIADDIYRRIKFDDQFLKVGGQYEVLRVCSEYRDDVLRLIAIHTFAKRIDALYEEKVLKRMRELKELDAADLSVILLETFKWREYQEQFTTNIGLDKEKAQRERIFAVKKDKSSVTFGGRSIYGSLLDSAAERYGWSIQYILWGISLINLQMMMQDSIQTMYLTEEDRKKAHVSTDGVIFKADDKSNNERIKQALGGKLKKK